MENLDDLPRSVREIAEVIGKKLTMQLIGQLRATESKKQGKRHVLMLYVPKRLPPDHELVQMIGFPAAHKLSQVFGGEILYPANCRRIYASQRDALILRMLEDGARPALVAELFGMTERQVRNLTNCEECSQKENPPEEKVPVDKKNNAGTHQPTEQQWTNRQA